jgi:hypothetical protein
MTLEGWLIRGAQLVVRADVEGWLCADLVYTPDKLEDAFVLQSGGRTLEEAVTRLRERVAAQGGEG